MNRYAAGFITALALLTAGVAPERAALAAAFPAGGTGDIWFLVDHAGFLGEGGGVIEEFYVRLPHDQLSFDSPGEDSPDPWRGRAFVRLTFFDDDARKIGEAARNFEFSAVDEAAAVSHDRVQLFVVREPLDPRTRAVRVDVEDMNARKRGLIYLITKQQRKGSTLGDLRPPPFQPGAFGLSDLQFAWSVDAGGVDPHFEKRGFNVVPNPGRTYGLYQDTLSAYYEVYDPAAPSAGRLVTRLEIRNDQGVSLGARVDTLEAPRLPGVWVGTPRLPVGKLPPGTYDLTLSVEDPAGGRRAGLSRPFNVIWSELSWGRSEQDVLDEARTLLAEDEYDRFKELQQGDRETYLVNFWTAHDPSPTTARNELREAFLQRVEYANRNYREFEKGMRSDRGRIYIRFGPPDEISREVLPRPGNTLTDVLDEEDSDLSGLISEKTTRSRRDTDLTANFQNVDTRPYEIWKYTRQGDPLFPERERITPNDGLSFIFVDEAGVGRYTLKFSNSFKRF